MILRCMLVDDEPPAVNMLESYVAKTPFLELVGKYNSAVTALAALKEHPVDLIFLDIQMPDLNGLEFSRLIGPDTRVIFITAFRQYALESYKVEALDYLLKPIRYADFLSAADKALRWFEMTRREPSVRSGEGLSPETIFIKTESRLRQIELQRILYVEGMKDYVKIFLENESEPVVSLMSLHSLEETLPADRFIRVHRSFIVQPEKIREIDRGRIVFGKERIPISDTYREAFLEFLRRRSLLPKM